MMTRRLQYEFAAHAAGPFSMALQNWQSDRKKARRKPRENPFGPPIESLRKLKDLMSVHYLKGRYADGAVPVAWVTSGFPVEVLRPLNFYAVYPEQHAALCGAQKLFRNFPTRWKRKAIRAICAATRAAISAAC
ncbi:MAG: hypothetical protein M5R36_05230 [Deltaproteobacteria bacterium]|nr:hypothetical protein [Deltaproteobacteria bacterium]